MDVRVSLQSKLENKSIAITGSKSETNRLLLLKALHLSITIKNSSVSDDSRSMQKALSGSSDVIDVHHAGTAMRFLTAYFAIQPGRQVLLTGSSRMCERPVGPLVDALRSLGADIQYTAAEGYPPLKINGKELQGGRVAVNATISSQFITALLLVGTKLKNGLEVTLAGEITSMPYIKMTLGLLSEIGVTSKFEQNVITVLPNINATKNADIIVESDWSSASYYYSVIALSAPGTAVTLSSFKQTSLQGDSALAKIYEQFGVATIFNDNKITLLKQEIHYPATVTLPLNNTPDIAQTIAVTCLGLGLNCTLTGLHTLKLKETDRLSALKAELEKFGAKVSVTGSVLEMHPSPKLPDNVIVDTYNDHRMAMSFAALAVKTPVIISDAAVVTKSYPAFWDDFKAAGFTVEKCG